MIEAPDDDIPDTSEIESAWSDIAGSDYDRLYAREQFRRWLAEHGSDQFGDGYDLAMSQVAHAQDGSGSADAREWLSQHDAQVGAQALREAADELESTSREQVRATFWKWRDYRAAVIADKQWKADVDLLRARADRIAP